MGSVVGLQHVSLPMPPGGNDTAREFYGKKLGLEEKTPPSSLDDLNLVWFRLGDGEHELHIFPEENATGGPGGQHPCIRVENLDEWREQLAANGVAVEETTAIENRPRFFVHDPFGNRLEITQVTGQYS